MAFDLRTKKRLTKQSRQDKIKSNLTKRGKIMQTVDQAQPKTPVQQIGNYVPAKPKTAPLDDTPFNCKRRNFCDNSDINKVHPYFFELLDMVSVRRRHNTKSELAFRQEYFKSLKISDKKTVGFNTLKSPEGQTLAYYYKASEDPVLWSSHIDSVHSGSGNVKVAFDTMINLVYVEDEACPLGADDAAGIWVLFQMIRAGIGGTFIFHVGEEVGGIGSSGVAKHHRAFLSRFKAAIAFDRKDTCSVITHQGMDRCCSEEFADSFCNALNSKGLQLVKDDGGVFTDTANYVDDIGECTNISVGYFDEHTQKESLDVEYLVNLTKALIEAFSSGFDNLKFKRKPGEYESSYQKYYDFRGNFNTGKSAGKSNRSFYDQYPHYDRATPPWESGNDPVFSEDMSKIEEDFFKVTCFDKGSELTYLRDDCWNDPDFSVFEMEVEQSINTLSRLNKQQVEDFILSSSEGFAACVIRKLLHEAGYV